MHWAPTLLYVQLYFISTIQEIVYYPYFIGEELKDQRS